MEDASPPKWHLGHTSWFFETFVLRDHCSDYGPFHPAFAHIFNSYYVSAGSRHARNERGLLSRPSLDEVLDYRAHVDAAIESRIDGLPPSALGLIELGLHHERQHQELLLTDILHAFSRNPTWPAYLPGKPPLADAEAAQTWQTFSGGVARIGHETDDFAFDNEGPGHEQILTDFALAQRPVSNAQWCTFMDDGGYDNALLWLSDGWAAKEREGWDRPLYWHNSDHGWQHFGAYGLQPLDLNAPVSHINFYEADAFARWTGARLPAEAEWEYAATNLPITGTFLESDAMTPLGGDSLYGDVWIWTQSPYAPYPRYKPASGTIGEYNGKFMANQMVLRGGSCLTPRGQMRPTYRNFFYPHQRWQMTGLRLAKDT